MIKVSVYAQSNYSLPVAKVKKHLREVLEKERVQDASASLAFVNDGTIDKLAKKYYKGDPENKYYHPILTFPAREAKVRFVMPEGEQEELGEIIISYPQAIARAADAGMEPEKIILDLVEHGALHLVGKHHR